MGSKILIITDSMMPFTANWGACQRIYHYAKKMVDSGIKVTVICHNTSDIPDKIEEVEGISVIGHGRKGVSEPSKSTSKNDKVRKKLQAIDRNFRLASMTVRSLYRFLYSEPNVLSGRSSKNWANTVMPVAIDYIRSNDIDVVILSGPSFGLFYHTEEIKNTGVKLILDYRDPWVSWYEKPTLASRIEKKAVNDADLVITTTDSLTNSLNSKYGTTKCYTIMNGYDKDLWNTIKQTKHDPEKLKISYIGNIKVDGRPGFRDPSCFFEAVKLFKQKHHNVEIQFVGVKDNLDDIDPQLKKYVEFRSTVPVAESLELTAEADVLLMFHTALDPSGKYIICGKAFDCMRSGNYVLSIGDVAYANKEFVERTESGIHCCNNKEAILNALEEIYMKWEKGLLIDNRRDIEVYSRDYQNNKFLQLIRAEL